jgi:hypothetical protein
MYFTLLKAFNSCNIIIKLEATDYYRKCNTTLVVQQQAGANKTTVETNRDYKETRNLQHTNQTSRRCHSVGKILTF